MLDQAGLDATKRAIAVVSLGAGAALAWWVVGYYCPAWIWHMDRAGQCAIIGLLIALLLDSFLKEAKP